MIHTFKLTTTAYNGSFLAQPSQKAYLRLSPFTTNTLTGTESSYGNYTFDVIKTDNYKLYNGPTDDNLSLNIAFTSATAGRLLLGDDFNAKNLTGTTSNVQVQLDSVTGGGGGSDYRYELIQTKRIKSTSELTDDFNTNGFWKKFQYQDLIMNAASDNFWDLFFKHKYWRICYLRLGTSEPSDYTELQQFSTSTDFIDFINGTVPFDDIILYHIYIEMYDKVNFIDKLPKIVRRSSLFSLMNGRHLWYDTSNNITDSYERYFASHPATWKSSLAETFVVFYKKMGGANIDESGDLDNSIISSSRANKKNIFGYPVSGNFATFANTAYNGDTGELVSVDGISGTAQNSFIFSYNPKNDQFNMFGYNNNNIVYYDESTSTHTNNLSEMLNSYNVIVSPILFNDGYTIAFKYNVANMDSFFIQRSYFGVGDTVELQLAYKTNKRYVSLTAFTPENDPLNEWIGYNINSIGNIPKIEHVRSPNSRKIYEKIKFCIRKSDGTRTNWISLFKIIRNKMYFPIRIITDLSQ